MDYRVLFAAPLAALVISVSAAEPHLPSPWKPMPMGLHRAPDAIADYSKEAYDIGVDPAAEQQGYRSLSIKSLVKLDPAHANFALAFQEAQGYAGKRLRFSGQIRSEGVSTWAGLFMDEISQGAAMFQLQSGLEGGENTLPPSGASGEVPYGAWQDVSVVVQVPATINTVLLGLALVGEGKVWARKLHFEVVGSEVPLTSTRILGFDWAKAHDAMVRNEKMMSSMPPMSLHNLALD
jgi:hypothetical protein